MLTLLTGGARSGKSRLAVDLAVRAGGPVTVVATAEGRDDEMRARIERHRAERPPSWRTREEPVELQGALLDEPDDSVVVVDCLTLWVSNLIERGRDDIEDAARRAAAVAAARGTEVIAVTNEVGSGVVPANDLARRFADSLGSVNAIWSAAAQRALLVVAGRVLRLDDPHA